MGSNITQETFETLEGDWKRLLRVSYFNSIFSTFTWKRLCWQKMSQGGELLLLASRGEGRLLGIAPLMFKGNTISSIGDERVCDYFDFIVERGEEERFFQAMTLYWERLGWHTIYLPGIPHNSPALSLLPPLLKSKGYLVEVQPADVCPGLELPGSWEEFLANLGGKERHELRRKMRRLQRVAGASFYPATDPSSLEKDTGDFIQMLKESRQDKAEFMTPEMEDFFHEAARALAMEGYLKLFFLEVNGKRVSSAMCFDYNGEYLLYNSGYNPEYAELSVGLILKALCIQDAISSGRRRFDFLKGSEPYKYDLGGVDMPIYRIIVKRRAERE